MAGAAAGKMNAQQMSLGTMMRLGTTTRLGHGGDARIAHHARSLKHGQRLLAPCPVAGPCRDVTAIIRGRVQMGPFGDEVRINESCEPLVLNELFFGRDWQSLPEHEYKYPKAKIHKIHTKSLWVIAKIHKIHAKSLWVV